MPPVLAKNCTHVKLTTGNPLLSHKIQKQLRKIEDPTRALEIITEGFGHSEPPVKKGYEPAYLKRIWDDKHRWKRPVPRRRVRMHMIYVDPNAGGAKNHVGIFGFFFDYRTRRYVNTIIDDRGCKNKKEFVKFVCEALSLYIEKICQYNEDERICLVVESQSRFDGESIKEELEWRRLAGNTDYQTVHVLGDKQREYDKTGTETSREGVNISQLRQKEMYRTVHDALFYDAIVHHEDLCTTHEYGIEFMIKFCLEQLHRYRPVEAGLNVGYDKNNVLRREGDPGGAKVAGQMDDVSDAFHGAFGWFREIHTDPFYRWQLRKMDAIPDDDEFD